MDGLSLLENRYMNQSIPTVIAAAEAAAIPPTAFDALTIVIVGFTFVMFTLMLLAAIVWGIGVCCSGFGPTESPPVTKKSEAPVVESVVPDTQVDPLETAVIAAAIHCVLGDQAHRIVSIRSSSSWAREGRREIFTSRRVR